MPLDITDGGFASCQLAKQITDTLENAKLALLLERPGLDKWLPGIVKANGQGTREFFAGLAHATDGALAAWEAGYRDPPIPQLVDALSGLCAYAAMMLRDNIMARILSGEVPGLEGTLALAVLKRFDDNPQSIENAAWFAGLLEGRQ